MANFFPNPALATRNSSLRAGLKLGRILRALPACQCSTVLRIREMKGSVHHEALYETNNVVANRLLDGVIVPVGHKPVLQGRGVPWVPQAA